MKRLVAFLIVSVFLLFPVSVCAAEERFDTVHDMYHYFEAHKKYPDYLCGVWSTDGTIYNLTISVLDNEEGRKGKQEILDWVREDSGITFEYAKYSRNHLCEIQGTLADYFKLNLGLSFTAILDDKNVVQAGIVKDFKDNPDTVEFIKSIKEEYGDAIEIVYTDGFVQEDAVISNVDGLVGDLPDVRIEYDASVAYKDVNYPMYALITALVLLGAFLIFMLFKRNKEMTLVTNTGETLGVSKTLSAKDVEQMVRDSEPEVTKELDEKVFKAIEGRK